MYADRRDAGRQLAAELATIGLRDPVVLGLPRGGVPVAHEVVAALGGVLDVLVVRKLGAPWHEELGIGALAEDAEPWWDLPALRQLGLAPEDLTDLVAREREELVRRRDLYRGGPLPALAQRDVVVVDDGLARGVTARAALQRVRQEGPSRLLLAVPVGAPDTVEALRDEADAIVCLWQPRRLSSVGENYRDFRQTTDAEVLHLLGREPG